MANADHLITHNLDLWASAVKAKTSAGRGSSKKHELYGIKKLRELILDLAVRGMLGAQVSSEESASEAIRVIEEERQKTMTQKKKNKFDFYLSTDNHPHVIPENWKWVRFGSIAMHNAGKTLDRGRNTGTPRKYLTTSNLYWGKFDLTEVREMKIRDDELEKCTAKKNDLLICEGGEAGRAAVWEEKHEICFQNHIHRARFYRGINPFFAFRFFEWLTASREIEKYRKGVGISNMSGKALASIPFPLAPLAEQHRIVTKVDELMALCDQLEQEQENNLETHETLVSTLLDALISAAADGSQFADAWQHVQNNFNILFITESSVDQLKQTILQLAVMGKLVPRNRNDVPVQELLADISKERHALKLTKTASPQLSSLTNESIMSIPNHWEWQRLEDLLTSGPTNGYSPKAVEYETPIRSLTLSATTSGTFNSEHFKFLDIKLEEDSNLWLKEGDILVQRGNTIDYVGVSAVYKGPEQSYIYPDLMMRVRLASPVNVDFIHLAMNNNQAREYLRNRASGTSGSMPKINQKALRSLPIPIPPISEQNRIVAKVDALMALCDQLKASLASAQEAQLILADSIVEQAIHSPA